MTEPTKIKSLAQAISDQARQSVPRDVLTPDQWIEQYNEIFAGLVVKECAKICETMTLLGPYKEIQDATLQDAAQQILEHFGVK